MIAAFFVLQLLTAPPPVAVVYDDVPGAVGRVSLYLWRDEASPVAVTGDILRNGSRVTVRGVSGQRTLVVFARMDGEYLVDGPFSWPMADVVRLVDGRWRRTARGGAPEALVEVSALEWLSASQAQGDQWPRCYWAEPHQWACWGVPVGEAGVLLSRASDRVWWSVVSGATAPDMRAAQWGRLLRVREDAGETTPVRVSFGHPVAPAQRLRGVRLDTAPVAMAQAVTVADGAVWVTGEQVPADAWAEVRSARGGPKYVPLREITDGLSSLPITIVLEESRSLDGVVVGAAAQRAGGALVTLFRLIDPAPSPGGPGRSKPRRVLASEVLAGQDGAFHLDGLGDADYELLAWHPQLGRVTTILQRREGVVTVRLDSPGIIRGRVVAAGKPLAGVDVISVPDPEAARKADDLVDLKGGDARTGEDGRFAVMAAAEGGGELRAGGGTFPIRRIPLPRAPSPLLELGDIDLGPTLEITIVLDQDPGCDVRAAGPVGRSGLQIVGATRIAPGLFRAWLPEAGLWEFGLLCGRAERSLSPGAVQISAAQAGKELRFSVR
jgi:hypothetical protein